jgi:hypothetical protein
MEQSHSGEANSPLTSQEITVALLVYSIRATCPTHLFLLLSIELFKQN